MKSNQTDTGELGPWKKLQPAGSEFVTWNGPELVLLHTDEQGGSLYGMQLDQGDRVS